MEGQAEAGLGRYNPQVGAVVIEVWKASGYDNSLSVFGEDHLSSKALSKALSIMRR